MQDENELNLDVNYDENESQDEHSEFDDYLSEILPDDDTDDDGESHDDDSHDGDAHTDAVSQQKKRPNRYKRKIGYLQEQITRVEQLARKREMELAQREAELETKDKFLQSLFQGTLPPTDQKPTLETGSVSQPTFTADDIDKRVEERLAKALSENMKIQSQNLKIAEKWNPQVARLRKELGKEPAKVNAFIKWLGDYTADVDDNPEKRTLLGVAGQLEYAAETLYTASKSQQFTALPLEEKIPLLLKLHTDISAKRKKITGADKSIERPRGTTPTKQSWVTMSLEDHVMKKLTGK